MAADTPLEQNGPAKEELAGPEEEPAFQKQASDEDEAAQREAELSAQWDASADMKREREEEERRKEEEEREKRERELRAAQEARELAAARAAEKARLEREEAERRKAQEEARKEAERRRRRVEAWLKEHGFDGGATDPKKTCCKTKYPIHSAAKRGEGEMIEMLILEGANPDRTDSKGKTALAIAERKNKGSSHQEAIDVLKDKSGSAS